MTGRASFQFALLPKVARVVGVVVAITGWVVLVGWALGVTVLKSVFPGLVAMNPATALCFIFSGLALGLIQSTPEPAPAHRLGRWLGLVVVAIGLIRLCACAHALRFDVDRILFRDELGTNSMAPNTAANFMFVGFALFFMDVETRRGQRPAQGLACATALLALLALLGYVYRIESLYSLSTFIPMALHTAAMFLVLALGILCAQPDRGVMAIFTSAGAGGVMARRMLPAVIATLALCGWLRLEGERRGLYTSELGVTLYTALTIAIFTALIWWNARALHRADAERETVNAQLRAVNKELEAFSYSVSHDLRAPLRAVDGFSQAVLEDYGPQLPAEGQRYLHSVRTAAQRMGQLIDDLLAFSRLSRQTLTRQPVDTGGLVRATLEELQAGQPARPVDIRITDLPACEADPALLKQVWVNLLSNALKYTQKCPAPVIEVGCRADNGAAVFWVRDNGAGFDMQYAHKLFGVFQRLHRADEYEGTGVGLAIVQRVVQRHGGRVWAEAVPDHGATFYFTLQGEPKL